MAPKANFRVPILLGVIVLMLMLLGVPAKTLLRERAQVAALQEQVDDAQATVNDLKDRKARLNDRAYVVALARERLNYVFPGEVGYVVLDDEVSTEIVEVPGAIVPNSDKVAWYSRLWQSTQMADEPQSEKNPFVVKSK